MKINNTKKNILLIIVLVLFVTAFFFLREDNKSLEEKFWNDLSKREEVVNLVKNKELISDISERPDLIKLPLKYRNLSEGGGEIIIENDQGLSVLFYTFRGVVDNFAGFVYKENNMDITKEDFNCGNILDSKKLKDNWFWVSCT